MFKLGTACYAIRYVQHFMIKNTGFFGLDIDSALSWKYHIDQLMFKLGTACYAIRYVQHFMIKNTGFFGLDIDSALSWKYHIDQLMFNLLAPEFGI